VPDRERRPADRAAAGAGANRTAGTSGACPCAGRCSGSRGVTTESIPAAVATPVGLPPTIEFRTGDPTRIVPADWESRVAQVRRELASDDIQSSELFAILATFRFTDDSGRTWTYTGDQWFGWDGQQWLAGTPPGPLGMSFSMDIAPEPGPEPVLPDSAGPPGYEPTHLTPPTGIPVWLNPDPSVAPVATLPPNLDVMVREWTPSGWAHVAASNGWTGWLDGRQLRPYAAPNFPTSR